MERIKPLQSVKKFYFLDYFYILLLSIEKHSKRNDIFSYFKDLKQKNRLGQSKYKRLTDDGENLTQKQLQLYKYTFRQVVEESKEYGLIKEISEENLTLSTLGREFLQIYNNKGFASFVHSMAKLMEDNYRAFRTLLEYLYQTNTRRSGVLIFPHYSPLELNFIRKKIQTSLDVRNYCRELVKRLESDIELHLKKTIKLEEKNNEIVNKLVSDGLLPVRDNEAFRPQDYNKITKRIRDFWINHFLKELYKCQYTMSTFDLWVYRAKQVGVINVTESYPFTNGKLLYPTAVVMEQTATNDFKEIYKYSDGKKLFVHDPESQTFQNVFVDELVKRYFNIRKIKQNYFINIAALREAVCYSLKISPQTFERLINEVYRLNLQGQLRIRISLEVDRLPEETNAMYLKQEPVMVDGNYRNIIAIDVTKGDKNEQFN